MTTKDMLEFQDYKPFEEPVEFAGFRAVGYFPLFIGAEIYSNRREIKKWLNNIYIKL